MCQSNVGVPVPGCRCPPEWPRWRHGGSTWMPVSAWMTPMAAWRECGRAGAYTVTRDTPTSPCRPRDAFRPATSNSPVRYRYRMYTIIQLFSFIRYSRVQITMTMDQKILKLYVLFVSLEDPNVLQVQISREESNLNKFGWTSREFLNWCKQLKDPDPLIDTKFKTH